MPASYLLDLERRVVFSRAWGVLTDADITAHAAALRSDARFDPSFRQVADFRAVSEIRVTGAVVRGIAFDNPFRREARRAFVVASDLAFGLARMFELAAAADAEEFRIVRTIEPALEWIGLDPATPWPSQAPDATFGVP